MKNELKSGSAGDDISRNEFLALIVRNTDPEDCLRVIKDEVTCADAKGKRHWKTDGSVHKDEEKIGSGSKEKEEAKHKMKYTITLV